MKPLTKEFLLTRGKCCKNSCRNCPYKEDEIPELEEINLKDRIRIFGILYPSSNPFDFCKGIHSHNPEFILVEGLNNAHIPTYKIKINK